MLALHHEAHLSPASVPRKLLNQQRDEPRPPKETIHPATPREPRHTMKCGGDVGQASHTDCRNLNETLWAWYMTKSTLALRAKRTGRCARRGKHLMQFRSVCGRENSGTGRAFEEHRVLRTQRSHRDTCLA